MVTYVIVGLILVELCFQVGARSAVRESRQRYVLLSLRRLTSWIVNAAFFGEGIVGVAANQPVQAFVYFLFGAGAVFLELGAHKDDDDWFNGRATKMKAGLHRIFAAPRRVSPAFG